MEEKRGHQFSFRTRESYTAAVAADYVRISLRASEKDIERDVREICAFADS
jgi:hypothetical protein